MSFDASVPFPAEDMSPCRGCGKPIGWVRGPNPADRPHPVDPKGWHGEPCAEGTPGSVHGRTLDGDHQSVRAFDGGHLFAPEGVVVFRSHFATCPDREKFYDKGNRRA